MRVFYDVTETGVEVLAIVSIAQLFHGDGP